MNKSDYLITLDSIRRRVPEHYQSDFDLQLSIREKNPTIALVLSLVFGAFGIDRFYLGHYGLGLLKLVTFGGLGIWTVIDWFLIMGAARKENITLAKEISYNFYYEQSPH